MSEINKSEIAVSVKDLYKTFKLPHEQHSGIKQLLVNRLKGVKGYENQLVLKDITFDIKKGEFFGIVGRNGSGKSTLLKILAGIYTPDKGSVQINGSLTPFIELGVGFNPELTGRENVFLNGALLGFSRKEMESMYESIVEFAELEKFMDQKLKNYSSGMQVRLAFSIAIRARSDILLIDEVLAVGDMSFQKKCFEYFELLKRERKTIILVTHDMSAVKRFCTKAILTKKGSIEAIGTAEDIADLYLEDNLDRMDEIINHGAKNRLFSAKFPKRKKFQKTDILEVKIILGNLPFECFLNISFANKGFVFADINTKSLINNQSLQSNSTISYSQVLTLLNQESYDVHLSLHRSFDDALIEQHLNAFSFIVTGIDSSRSGPLRLDGEWSIKSEKII